MTAFSWFNLTSMDLTTLRSQTGLSTAAAAVGLVLATTLAYRLSKQSDSGIIPAHKRHLLPLEPCDRIVGLGPGEQQYVRIASDNGGNRIFLVATVKGPRVSRDRLAFAARCVQRLHPFLRCRLIRTPQGQVALQEDCNLLLNIDVRNRTGSDTFRQVFHAEAEKTVHAVGNDAPSPHKLWLFQSPSGGSAAADNDEEVTEIVLDIVHFAIDGSSLAPLMHEILQYTLAAEHLPLPPYGAWPVTQEQGLVETFANGLSSRLAKEARKVMCIFNLIYFALSRTHVNLERDLTMEAADYARLNSTLCVCETLSAEETTRLVLKCRENQISITAAVSAVYLEACAETRQPDLGAKPFPAILAICADSRKVSTPPAPATNLAPYVYTLPSFASTPRVWKYARSGMTGTWQLAQEIRDHIKYYISRPVLCALHADLIAFMFSQHPAPKEAPMPIMIVSSWCASAPVLETYGRYKVLDVELLQNMAFTSWVSISMYTFLGKLHITVLCATPLFKEETVREISRVASARVRAMIGASE